VPHEVVGKVLKSFTGMYLEDRKLVVRLDGEDPKGASEKRKANELSGINHE